MKFSSLLVHLPKDFFVFFKESQYYHNQSVAILSSVPIKKCSNQFQHLERLLVTFESPFDFMLFPCFEQHQPN